VSCLLTTGAKTRLCLRPLGLLSLFVVLLHKAESERALNAVLLLGAACTHSVVTSRQRQANVPLRHLISILRTLALANYPGDAPNVSEASCSSCRERESVRLAPDANAAILRDGPPKRH
jgi:hypothetical protein